MARLLQRNQHAIASAKAGVERARLLARRVLLLARHWRVSELPEALLDAETAVAATADCQAAAELALARGVAMYYGAQAHQAVGPVQQACDAAREFGDAGLEAECEAWLGCIGATLHTDPMLVLQHLNRAAQLGATHRPLAAARGCYIAGTLYQEADLIEPAMAHYRRATALARRENDEQLVAAIHRYMTLAQVQQCRRAQAAGRLDPEEGKQALAALGSARQLAVALTADDVGLQFNLRLGEMLCLIGRFAEALEVFDAHVHDAARRGMSWEATIVRADHAVCLVRCGRPVEAAAAGALARAELADSFDAYTRAVVHGSLAELAVGLGDAAQAATHKAAAQSAWAEDRAYCAGLRQALLGQGPLTD